VLRGVIYFMPLIVAAWRGRRLQHPQEGERMTYDDGLLFVWGLLLMLPRGTGHDWRGRPTMTGGDI
jgi:hypothetical protein